MCGATKERDGDNVRSIKKVLCPPPFVVAPLYRDLAPYQKRIRAHLADPHSRATPLSLTSRSLRRRIFILIVDRLTTAERAFSTPPPSPFGQSARDPPAILVHTDAARTCTVLLLPAFAASRGGCSLVHVCARQLCACVCARARACSSRQSISIREQKTREKAASLTRGQAHCWYDFRETGGGRRNR